MVGGDAGVKRTTPPAAAPNGAATGFTVDPWDPGYASALGAEALAEFDATDARLDLDVEVPADRWRPIEADPATRAPAILLVADGVRRIDARIWTSDADGAPVGGVAVSYAAGLARCDQRRASADLVAVRVRRGLFTPAARAGIAGIATAVADYPAYRAVDSTPERLNVAVQQQLTALEVDVAAEYRSGGDGAAPDDLLLVDGPLRDRTHLPRAVGYVKTHHTGYLGGGHAGVVAALAPGQRTPVFVVGTSWSRHSWYLRLPSRSPAPWAGVARCEASPDIPVEEARNLADLTAVVLPSLAGVEYKDPRAPQNLVPIGGLEKLLRHRLGDARLLYRALRAAAAR